MTMRKQTAILLGIGSALAFFWYAYSKGQNWAVSAVCSAISTVAGMFPKNWLSLGAAYVPSIESIGAQYGLPQYFLSAVAFQESSFNPSATNPSGASGMFQLMPQYYPGVDPFNWQQAAGAAAQSLAGYFNQFGDWQLALAAYNWGPGNLANYMNTAQSVSITGLPSETQNYVTRIASATGVGGELVA
jgi:soluble lytic murein transglycosylase-like protein